MQMIIEARLVDDVQETALILDQTKFALIASNLSTQQRELPCTMN